MRLERLRGKLGWPVTAQRLGLAQGYFSHTLISVCGWQLAMNLSLRRGAHWLPNLPKALKSGRHAHRGGLKIRSFLRFLIFLGVLRSFLSPNRASALVAGVGPCDSGGRVSKELLVVGGDGGEGGLLLGSGSGQDDARVVGGSGGLALLGGGVVDESLLGLAVLSGEEDQLRLVLVESLHVQLQLLLARRSASVVDGNTDSASEGGAQASTLQLSQSEATAVSDLAGVPSRGGRHDGTQLVQRPGEHCLSFRLSLLITSKLLAWLVEVDADSELPVLAEMYVCNAVVVLDHC